jgi:hypothetical protein
MTPERDPVVFTGITRRSEREPQARSLAARQSEGSPISEWTRPGARSKGCRGDVAVAVAIGRPEIRVLRMGPALISKAQAATAIRRLFVGGPYPACCSPAALSRHPLA